MASLDDRALRILLTVHHDLAPGTGAPGSTLALADELAGRGHHVEVLGLDLLGRRRGATLDAVRFPHAVRRLLVRLLERDEVDVVDASTGDLAYVSAAHVRTSRAAVFTRSHGLEQLVSARRREGARRGELRLRRRYALYHGGARLWEVARSFRVADGALVLNDAEAAYCASSFGFSAARIWRTAELAAGLPPPPTLPPLRDVLVLGPSSWRKGGDVAVKVLEAVLRADGSLTASWHGLDDPASMSSTVASDVRPRLDLAGRYDRERLAGLLSSHRVLLFASRAEGLPVTLLEALAARIAVVGADVPGVHDLLADGAGALVPDGHVQGFVGAVLALLADETARTSCVERGAAVAARFAPAEVVDRLVVAYRTVLAAKRGA